MGVGVLIVGVILFGYGSLTIPRLFEKMREQYAPGHLVETVVNMGMGPSPFQILEQQLFLV